MFKISCESGKARTGLLRLKRCRIKTPFFMPVATRGIGRYADTLDLKQSKTQCVISNSLLLDMYIGSKKIESMGGLHRFMRWNGGIFTDSGGFQMHSDHIFIGTKKDGIEFRNPSTGKKVFCTPEDSMEIQQAIGSDVAMCLDDMPEYSSDKKRLSASMDKTFEWAKRCRAHHESINSKGQLLFGICQGGTYPELRKKSAEMISSIDFDGLAFGGLAIGEPMEKMFSSIKSGIQKMDKEKFKYLMGVGVPSQIIKAVEMGVDCFDSTYPTMTARHNWLLTKKGIIAIDKKEFSMDSKPVDEGCSCPACRNFTRSYMHHMARAKEHAGFRLRTLHNIHFMAGMMDDIRKAIKEGNMKSLKKEYSISCKKK